MAKYKLRVGLLLNSNSLPSWLFSCIKSLIHSEYAEIVLVINNEMPSLKKKSSISKIKEVSYFLFRKIENKFHKSIPNALIKKNLNSILSNCRECSISTIETKDLKQIDLIIHFGQNSIPKQI